MRLGGAFMLGGRPAQARDAFLRAAALEPENREYLAAAREATRQASSGQGAPPERPPERPPEDRGGEPHQPEPHRREPAAHEGRAAGWGGPGVRHQRAGLAARARELANTAVAWVVGHQRELIRTGLLLLALYLLHGSPSFRNGYGGSFGDEGGLGKLVLLGGAAFSESLFANKPFKTSAETNSPWAFLFESLKTNHALSSNAHSVC
mmetsp:Transcript_37331/g.83542  ORF Transcript_37331/g.83542 Transcript_37331/m.83542 type:complete len:207 (+) Transcript_37331:88-708(+)